MTKTKTRICIAVAACVVASVSCQERSEQRSEGAAAEVTAPTPPEFRPGERLFEEHCVNCHGIRAGGTSQGPPLLHRIYEPGHHADISFYRAVEFGVRPHHWSFGPMPPIDGLDREEVGSIVRYVRWLQREAGIY